MQAESVNELVGARTAAAADSAIAGLTGGIGSMVQKLRRSALVLLAELEVRCLTPACLLSCLGCLPFAVMPSACPSTCLSQPVSGFGVCVPPTFA